MSLLSFKNGVVALILIIGLVALSVKPAKGASNALLARKNRSTGAPGWLPAGLANRLDGSIPFGLFSGGGVRGLRHGKKNRTRSHGRRSNRTRSHGRHSKRNSSAGLFGGKYALYRQCKAQAKQALRAAGRSIRVNGSLSLEQKKSQWAEIRNQYKAAKAVCKQQGKGRNSTAKNV